MSRVLMFLRQYRTDGLMRTTDADVQAAAESVAATHETAARGIIFEQRAPSLPAQRLAAAIAPLVEELGRDRGTSFHRDIAAVFRAIERGAREVHKTLPGGATAYLELLRRLLVPAETGAGGVEQGPSETGQAPPIGDGGSLLIRP